MTEFNYCFFAFVYFLFNTENVLIHSVQIVVLKSRLNLDWNRYNFCCWFKMFYQILLFFEGSGKFFSLFFAPFPHSWGRTCLKHAMSVSFSVALLSFQHRPGHCRAFVPTWAELLAWFLMDSPFSSVQRAPSVQIIIESIYSQCQKQPSFSLAFAFREAQLVDTALWPFSALMCLSEYSLG